MHSILRYCLLAVISAGCVAFSGAPGGGGAALAIPAAGGGDMLHAHERLPVVTVRARKHAGGRKSRRKKRKTVRSAIITRAARPNVILRATMAPGGPPVTEGLAWRIVELGATPDLNRLIWSGSAAEPRVRLDPGRYRVETQLGLVKKLTTITVGDDAPVNTSVVLNAGTIRARSVSVAGGPTLNDVFFVLRGTDAVHTHDLDRSAQPVAVFHVPVGIYRVLVQHGLARSMVMADVQPGQVVTAEAVMNTGELSLAARATSDGPPLSGATFTVFHDSDDPARKEIIRSVRDEPRFDLPAGTYRVTASLGLARVERKVTIKPGTDSQEHFVLNAGGVRLSSSHAGTLQPVEKALQYRVYAVASGDAPLGPAVTTSASISPTIFLREGKYRIESQYGWQNARQVREVSVAAGKMVDVSFVHNACNVNLKLVPKAGTMPMPHVKWTLKYTGGGTVLISQDANPALILQAGSYQATAQHDNRTYTRIFEATTNAEQTIELIAE